jgi:hypothetical protein
LEPPGLIRPVGIITKRGKELPVEAARFVEFLLQNAFADQAEAVKKPTASSSAAS